MNEIVHKKENWKYIEIKNIDNISIRISVCEKEVKLTAWEHINANKLRNLHESLEKVKIKTRLAICNTCIILYIPRN